MTTVDVSKLRYSELQELIKDAQQALVAKRADELKVLADGYAKKCHAAGFTIEEAVDALASYLPSKGRKGVAKAAKASGMPKPVPGTTYRNPDTGEKWTRAASGRGRTVSWLQQLVDSGRSLEEFVVK
jgi:DNA-binding protein H-NS